MNKILTKILVCILISLCFITSFAIYSPVKASTEISALSYEEQDFSFKGSCKFSYQCSTMFLNVSVNATASNNNNETITMEVSILKRNVTKTYTFYSDGQTHQYKNIFLGFSGGSDVRFKFTGANPEITIYTHLSLVGN